MGLSNDLISFIHLKGEKCLYVSFRYAVTVEGVFYTSFSFSFSHCNISQPLHCQLCKCLTRPKIFFVLFQPIYSPLTIVITWQWLRILKLLHLTWTTPPYFFVEVFNKCMFVVCILQVIKLIGHTQEGNGTYLTLPPTLKTNHLWFMHCSGKSGITRSWLVLSAMYVTFYRFRYPQMGVIVSKTFTAKKTIICLAQNMSLSL
jgi:hypothetical protein